MTSFLISAAMLLQQHDFILPSVIGSNMVLQRRSRPPVWGWSIPDTVVTLKPGWSSEVYRVRADSSGKWMARIRTGEAGGPYTLRIEGPVESTTLTNVLLGEVWLCSGQSNMEWPLGPHQGLTPVEGGAEDAARANDPQMRLFTVGRQSANQPRMNCAGSWAPCSPELAHDFSATAFYFGRQLRKELGVPIGLVVSAVGGTEAELWTSEEELASLPEVKHPNRAKLFNGMIAPLAPYDFRGVIWYQGESNVGRAAQYQALFPALIGDWRTRFEKPKLPFYFVQIAPFPYDRTGTSCVLRESQQWTAQNVANTGMVVTTDITPNVNDIHPPKKREVGERLASLALRQLYSKPGEVSPMYSGMRVEGSRIRLFFKPATPLKGTSLQGFEIAGVDKNYHPAKAEISGKTIVVSSDQVRRPVAVRYCWSDTATSGAITASGLPIGPFRTQR